MIKRPEELPPPLTQRADGLTPKEVAENELQTALKEAAENLFNAQMDKGALNSEGGTLLISSGDSTLSNLIYAGHGWGSEASLAVKRAEVKRRQEIIIGHFSDSGWHAHFSERIDSDWSATTKSSYSTRERKIHLKPLES